MHSRLLILTIISASLLFSNACTYFSTNGKKDAPSNISQTSQSDLQTKVDEKKDTQSVTSAQDLPPLIEPLPLKNEEAASGEEEASATSGENPSQNGEENLADTEDKSESTEKQGQTTLDEALDFCEVAQSFWQKGELENALEGLDKAYSLILEVDTKEDAKLIQQKEDLRYLISKRILEIYASRNIVVNGNHNEIPLEMNQHIQAELKRFTNGEKAFFEQSYKRSGRYRGYILEALRKEGLPEELSWLPLIESGFKVKALSRARALGLWQFIPSTGYKFGLKRNSYIDERIDFIKATDAAITYLKELHNIFGDWATVLAAYNCGEGRVLHVIRTQRVNYLDNFWDLYQRLPLETARYVPRFYATLHMVKNPAKYGLDLISPDPELEYDNIEVKRQVHLSSISKATGIDLSVLKTLNPELRYQLLPPDPYSLRVPKSSEDQILAKIDTIPVSQLPQRSYVRHRVRSGETLGTIARKYRTTVGRIMRANNLRRSNFIRAGKTLKIPQRGYMQIQPSPVKQASVPASGTHYVRKGDSLWIIAKQYGTTVKKIRDENNLPSNHLYIGQALKIPGFKTEPLPDTNQLSTYSVKSGDSPYTIAKKHNMALERLLLINKLNPRSKIFPGQQLYIE